MSVYSVAPLELAGLTTTSLASRESKFTAQGFARPVTAAQAALLDVLPDVLAGRSLRALVERTLAAKRAGRPVLLGLGAHVFKVGLSPILIQLVEEGLVDGLALNGAGIVHDYEIALCGSTSEDVDAALPGGRFGVTKETAEALNGAIVEGARDSLGIGEAVGRMMARLDTPTAHYGVLAACYERRVPVTVHLAIGADVIHLHPSADGAAMGAGSHRDFRLFAALVAGMNGGGVYMNIGSAVILPEVFLKCVTLVRNLGRPLEGFTTANFDFLQHYRPLTNVVRRPVAGSGAGFSFTGHHEIMIPLLAAALIRGRQEPSRGAEIHAD